MLDDVFNICFLFGLLMQHCVIDLALLFFP